MMTYSCSSVLRLEESMLRWVPNHPVGFCLLVCR